MPGDNLILIGFMGTGKSTVGALCAEILGFTFRDTDALIVDRAGRSIPEIFASEGEAGFRDREEAVIAELAAGTKQVIATGGGAILNRKSATQLRTAGSVVGLAAHPTTILERVGRVDSRPLLKAASNPENKIIALLAQRTPLYEELAHCMFKTDHVTPERLASDIAGWYRGGGVVSLEVSLGERAYPIVIQEGCLASGFAAEKISELTGCDRVCVVTHPALRSAYSDPLEARLRSLGISVDTVPIPPGERYKTIKTVTWLYDAFVDARLDRKSVVVAVGGGVLGDTVGFACATYLRGIRVIQCPTTLLSQVDSSVGGKTGVDLAAGKNLVGAFHQPTAVFIDTTTLRTLPRREIRSGLAEVIKYGIIYDASFFSEIGRNVPNLLRREREPLSRAIARSCSIKADVVAQDETEQGLRAILNFGHTVGHALESVTAYRRYKHGEAISIGMVSAALIGEVLGVTPSSVTREICRVLMAAGLPLIFPDDIASGTVLDAAQRDKKTQGGRLRFVLARALGDVYVHVDVPRSAVVEAIDRHRRREFPNG